MSKNKWQIITTILALMAVGATYNVYYISRPIKELQVTIDAAYPLVSVVPEAEKDIQILYKEKVVENVEILQLSIENTGNQPILTTDFISPLEISVGKDNLIIDWSIIKIEPSSIGITLSQKDPSKIVASPDLLNPNDIVSIKIIVIKSDEKPIIPDLRADGRIVGVKEIKIIDKEEDEQKSLYLVVSIIGITTAVISMAGSIYSAYRAVKEEFRKSREVEANITKAIKTKKK